MNRKDYDEYKEVAKEAIKLLIATGHLPLIFSYIGIDPSQHGLIVELVDTAAQRSLDGKYGLAWPADKRDADKKAIFLPSIFWKAEDEHDAGVMDRMDRVYGIDPSASEKAKAMCRVGVRVVND